MRRTRGRSRDGSVFDAFVRAVSGEREYAAATTLGERTQALGEGLLRGSRAHDRDTRPGEVKAPLATDAITHDGQRASAELGAILWHALGGPKEAPELARWIQMPHDDPIVALSVSRGRRAEYAVANRADRFARTCAFPGRAVWLIEIAHAKGDIPDAVAVWRSPDGEGGWETRCACLWTGAGRDAAKHFLVIGTRWGRDTRQTRGASCVFGADDAPGPREARRREAQIRRRCDAIGARVLADIAVGTALAWLDAHGGQIRTGGTMGGAGPLIAPVPAPAREAPPAWLGARAERAAEALVLLAAREGWSAGGSCAVTAWRDGWAGRAELGAIAWRTIEDRERGLDQDDWRALERTAGSGRLKAQTRYPALAAAGALVSKMLVQTERAPVARADDARGLSAIEIPARLWKALAAAGPCPDRTPALDLDEGWWLVEIERPGDEDPNAIALWEDAGARVTLAVFMEGKGRIDKAGVSVLTWRTHADGTISDTGVGILTTPIRVDDPNDHERRAATARIIASLTMSGTGAIARAETAIALHRAHRGETAPLGPYRASVNRGHERTARAGRAGAGVTRLFALERAPEPERAPEASRDGSAGQQRAGAPLKALHTVGAHWKRQAHGPRRSKRRWIVIEPYERGPKAEADQIVMTRVAERQGAPRGDEHREDGERTRES